MPSYDQIVELCKKCIRTRAIQNGVYGQLVKGPNGNTMFLPAASYRCYDSLYYAGTYGFYWSRTLDYDPGSACRLYFGSGNEYDYMYWYVTARCYGFPVRAVRVSQN